MSPLFSPTALFLSMAMPPPCHQAPPPPTTPAPFSSTSSRKTDSIYQLGCVVTPLGGRYQLSLLPAVLSFLESNPSACVSTALVVLCAWPLFLWVRHVAIHVLPPSSSSSYSHQNLDTLSLVLLFAKAWMGGRR